MKRLDYGPKYIYPEGIKTTIRNLTHFAKHHGLLASGFYPVLKGEKENYNGYKILPL